MERSAGITILTWDRPLFPEALLRVAAPVDGWPLSVSSEMSVNYSLSEGRRIGRRPIWLALF
jgi:hypothetical protein